MVEVVFVGILETLTSFCRSILIVGTLFSSSGLTRSRRGSSLQSINSAVGELEKRVRSRRKISQKEASFSPPLASCMHADDLA